MSTLNGAPIRMSSLFRTSATRSTLKSVGCRALAARFTTAAVDTVHAVDVERLGEAGRDATRGLYGTAETGGEVGLDGGPEVIEAAGEAGRVIVPPKAR